MTGKRIRFGRIFAIVLALSSPLPAQAWNAAGHRLIAAIAWEHLTPSVRDETSHLLNQHADYGRWLKRAGQTDSARRVFIEASTWPDDIRKDKRFYSTGHDEPTPVLPGFPDMERRGSWHYVNIPLDATLDKTPRSGQLDTQLVELSKTLGSSTADQERTYALPWLIHLAGDAHQPLHTSVRLDAEGNWDKRGNGLKVQNPFSKRKPTSTLHAFWDDLPGPPWLRDDKLDATAQGLMAAHPRQARSTSGKRWIEESWKIARDNAYPPETTDAIPTISDAFYKNSREIADQRIVLAGYRLADLLNQLLKPKR